MTDRCLGYLAALLPLLVISRRLIDHNVSIKHPPVEGALTRIRMLFLQHDAPVNFKPAANNVRRVQTDDPLEGGVEVVALPAKTDQ